MSVCWCCISCWISLQSDLIVALSWFIWLIWILVCTKCTLVGLDCCCVWCVCTCASTVNCWTKTLWFKGVCVLGDNITRWCVESSAANTQAWVSGRRVHSMIATWWRSYCIWLNTHYVTTVRENETREREKKNTIKLDKRINYLWMLALMLMLLVFQFKYTEPKQQKKRMSNILTLVHNYTRIICWIVLNLDSMKIHIQLSLFHPIPTMNLKVISRLWLVIYWNSIFFLKIFFDEFFSQI